MNKSCISCHIKATILMVALLNLVLVLFCRLVFDFTPTTLFYVITTSIGIIAGHLIAGLVNEKRQITKQLKEDKTKLDSIHNYIGNVVHDLRSPVASINMIAEFLEEELPDLSTQQHDLVVSIKKSSTTMLDRICCILDNTRLEKGINFEDLIEGSPYDPICQSIEKHQILAIDKNITIINKIPEKLPNTYFDKEALDSVLSNLISNAIKYSLPNTTVQLYHIIEKGKVIFCIKDEGLGMSDEDLKKVFGEFAKLSARPTGGEGSSGLGLSLVKKLVEQMGGTVSASSEGKGKGSTFSFSLKTTAMVKVLTA